MQPGKTNFSLCELNCVHFEVCDILCVAHVAVDQERVRGRNMSGAEFVKGVRNQKQGTNVDILNEVVLKAVKSY